MADVILNNAAFETEKAFEFLTGSPRTDPSRYNDAKSPLGKQHKEWLRQHWMSGLRDKLITYGWAPPMLYSEDMQSMRSSASPDA
jgi:hypothetical protein